MNDADRKWLVDRFGPRAVFNKPMATLTTFGIGGPADALVTVKADAEMQDVIRWARAQGHPVMILGAGSNLLVRDGGIRGIVIKLANGFESIERTLKTYPDGAADVVAGAGVLVRRLAKYAIDRGLAGLSFAMGIPGTVGGALCMNAGAWGACIADTVDFITVLRKDGDIANLAKDELHFTYRRLDLEEGAVILRGQFHLMPADRETLLLETSVMEKKRRATQPLHLPSAGSIFRNPSEEMSAGELIDQTGLKGLRMGGAQVSQRHANFIVNRGGARACDVIALMKQITGAVMARFGINLEPEVAIVGEEANSEKPL